MGRRIPPRSRPRGRRGFVDPGNSGHSAYNPSETEEVVVIATFLDVGEDEKLTQPIPDAREAEELNDA